MIKSMTIIGDPVNHAFIIKGIDGNKLTVDKFEVDCREDVIAAWAENKTEYVEIILTDKVSTITLEASAPTIEKAIDYTGKIIKNIVTERLKKGRKVRIVDIELFEEFVK